jgi:nitroreductase
MDVTQALMTRSSIRAFLPDPIDRETMLKLLNAAIRTPSWANSQPWEVYIAQGKNS